MIGESEGKERNSTVQRIMVIFGTRPEAIKLSPVIKEISKYPTYLRKIVVVTAQHREMLDQVLSLFNIQPDFDLNIMEEDQSLSEVAIHAIIGLHKVIKDVKPDIVLVQGDTTSSFIGSLISFYHRIPVGHIEAGLRTGDKYFPYPEEINRRLITVLTDLHFTPTVHSKERLLKEGVDPKNIYVTGNTVIDALLTVGKKEFDFSSSPLGNINFQQNRVILVTTHRRENFGKPLRDICEALKRLINRYPDIEIVYPVHLNPKVQSIVKNTLRGLPRVHLIPPLDYEVFVNLMKRCFLILTDSGGIQEEAPTFGKPVLVLRKVTEREEALKAKTVKVVGTVIEDIYNNTCLLLDNKSEYEKMSTRINPYGDGKASYRIVKALLYYFGIEKIRPHEFIG